jgi:hypothetical protein
MKTELTPPVAADGYDRYWLLDFWSRDDQLP